MLGLKSPPLETTLPGHTRRRLWSHPELTSHSVLVLTFERLYLAPFMGVPKPEMLAAIEAGADLDAILGSLAIVIDLDNLRSLSLDLIANSLTIEHTGRRSAKSKVRITFASPEAADSCFTKIWRRLDGFQLAPYQRDTWHSVRAPLAVLVLILMATAGLAALLSIHEDRALTQIPTSASSRSEVAIRAEPVAQSQETLLDVLSWKVVCGLGGVASALSQVWLYRRLTAPPVSLELVKGVD